MTCFVCLENTRATHASRCSTCAVRAHTTCWSEFISFELRKASIEREWGIVDCPQCHLPIQLNPHHTRSVVDANNRRILFVQTLSGFLEEVLVASDEDTRKRVAGTLFDYVCAHRALVELYPSLQLVLQDKLVGLHYDGWMDAQSYYARLFG
jgi:hypothetical protein